MQKKKGNTTWHPKHIADRYGSFTLILLGESLLSSANALLPAMHQGNNTKELVLLGMSAMIVTALLWWIYFWPEHHHLIGSLSESIFYGYGHYFIFVFAGALSAGVGVGVDKILGETSINAMLTTYLMSIPIAGFVLGTWIFTYRCCTDKVIQSVIAASVLIMLFAPIYVNSLAIQIMLLTLIVLTLVIRERNSYSFNT